MRTRTASIHSVSIRIVLILAAALLIICRVAVAESVHFQKAVPLWPAAFTQTMNAHIGFRAVVEIPGKASTTATLRVAAASVYRIFVNGEFAGYGPARGAAGYARVDEWPVALHRGKNLVAIEAAGYNVNSFYLTKQPPFLRAELVDHGRVLAATETSGGFEAVLLPEFAIRTQRYSFQRPFTEVYTMAPGYDRWRRDFATDNSALPLTAQSPNQLLPRRVPLPDFTVYAARTEISEGTMRRGPEPANLWRDRFVTQVPSPLDGYPESDIPKLPSIELQRWKEVERREVAATLAPISSFA